MKALLFGTGGAPHSARGRSTVDGIKRIAELGLGCMEIEFVYGVRMDEAGARLVAATAAEQGITLTAHAPYYINLNAREETKIKASQDRILQTARIGAMCEAVSIALHTASYMGDPPEQVYETVKKYLGEIISRLKKERNGILVSPEIMGKIGQFGTIDEILNLSIDLEQVAPCIDFAHWHARTGAFNSYPEFVAILEQIGERLGSKALDNLHIHLSGIDYSGKGEKRHLDLKDSDLRYKELLRALKDLQIKGTVVCESPNLEEDALLLQETYEQL